MNTLKKYIDNQVLNGYITEAEKNFLLSNLPTFKNELPQLEKASAVADFRNDNKNFIRTILNTLMNALGVIAII